MAYEQWPTAEGSVPEAEQADIKSPESPVSEAEVGAAMAALKESGFGAESPEQAPRTKTEGSKAETIEVEVKPEPSFEPEIKVAPAEGQGEAPPRDARPQKRSEMTPEEAAARENAEIEKIAETMREKNPDAAEQQNKAEQANDAGGGSRNVEGGKETKEDDKEPRGAVHSSTIEQHSTFKDCNRCGGSGRWLFFFRCPKCRGTGQLEASRSTTEVRQVNYL